MQDGYKKFFCALFTKGNFKMESERKRSLVLKSQKLTGAGICIYSHSWVEVNGPMTIYTHQGYGPWILLPDAPWV